VEPPYNALTCEESTTALDQSSFAAAFSSASRTSGRRCHTPASFQSRSQRQQVIPEPNPSSCGRRSHWMPVCSKNGIPHSTSRSGTALQPGYLNRRSLLGHDPRRGSHDQPNAELADRARPSGPNHLIVLAVASAGKRPKHRDRALKACHESNLSRPRSQRRPRASRSRPDHIGHYRTTCN
jgi:hypothetical protein